MTSRCSVMIWSRTATWNLSSCSRTACRVVEQQVSAPKLHEIQHQVTAQVQAHAQGQGRRTLKVRAGAWAWQCRADAWTSRWGTASAGYSLMHGMSSGSWTGWHCWCRPQPPQWPPAQSWRRRKWGSFWCCHLACLLGSCKVWLPMTAPPTPAPTHCAHLDLLPGLFIGLNVLLVAHSHRLVLRNLLRQLSLLPLHLTAHVQVHVT